MPISIIETTSNQFKVVSLSYSPYSGNKTVNTKGNEDLWIYDLNSNVSIGSLENDATIVYPNPVKDKLFFSHPLQNTDLKLYNPIGQLILETKIHDSSIETDRLTNGIYFIELSVGENKIVKTIIKD